MRFLGQLHQQNRMTTGMLHNWLDRTIKHLDILQRESLPFLQRLVKSLVEERSIPIAVLIRNAYLLCPMALILMPSEQNSLELSIDTESLIVDFGITFTPSIGCG